MESRKFSVLPGRALDIGIGADNIVWVVGISKRIFRWNESKHDWDLGSDKREDCRRVAVDRAGTPWVVADDNKIYHFANGQWKILPGRALDIGVGADNTVWVVGISQRIFRWNESKHDWDLGSDERKDCRRVAVDRAGTPWVVADDRKIYHFANGQWKTLPGRALDIGVGADNTVWVVGISQRIFQWNESKHDWIHDSDWDISDAQDDHQIGSIAVMADGTPWVLTENDQIWKPERTGSAQGIPSQVTIELLDVICHDTEDMTGADEFYVVGAVRAGKHAGATITKPMSINDGERRGFNVDERVLYDGPVNPDDEIAIGLAAFDQDAAVDWEKHGGEIEQAVANLADAVKKIPVEDVKIGAEIAKHISPVIGAFMKLDEDDDLGRTTITIPVRSLPIGVSTKKWRVKGGQSFLDYSDFHYQVTIRLRATD